MSAASRSAAGVGELLNMMANDVQRVGYWLWDVPVYVCQVIIFVGVTCVSSFFLISPDVHITRCCGSYDLLPWLGRPRGHPGSLASRAAHPEPCVPDDVV